MRSVDAIDCPGAVIGVRIDIDSDLDTNGDFTSIARHKAHSTTIDELADSGARVVVLAHQTNTCEEYENIMQKHANTLDEYIDTTTVQMPQDFDDDELNSILSTLEDGEVLLLDNILEFEQAGVEFDTQQDAAQTELVEQLAPEFDAYVNDAFSLSHQRLPSIVGFPAVLPSYEGRVLESERTMLSQVRDNTDMPLYIFGGVEVSERLSMIEQLLETESTDRILTTGLVGAVFLYAGGYDLGENMKELLEEIGEWEAVNDAAELLTLYGEYIQYPNDVAVEDSGNRAEFALSACPLPSPVCDIGQGTVDEYCDAISSVDGVVASGPAGVIESEQFQSGTKELFSHISEQQYSVVAGQTTLQACDMLDVTGFTHSCTGSQAAITYLITGELSGLNVLLPSD